MHQHDCVVIPHFGGLVANYTPGFADEKSNLLHPPKKGFIWNKFLQHNDGLLAHEICKEEGLSYDAAVNLLNEFVADCKNHLATSKRFDFSVIGTLIKADDSTLTFVPSKDNYLLSSFGLPIVKSLALPKLEKETPLVTLPINKVELTPDSVEDKKPLAKVVDIKESTKIIEKRKTVNSKWWIAAALIPIGFYSAWIPMKTDMLKGDGNFQYSDLNPFSFQKSEGIYSEYELEIPDVDSVMVVDFTLLDNTVNNITENDFVETPESTYVDSVVPEINYTANNEKAYFVIGGCFADKINAETFIQDLKSKGFDAQLVDFHQGLHRVAFGKFESRKEAKTAKSDITSSGEYSAWVLKKG
jgi:hypothetical protein